MNLERRTILFCAWSNMTTCVGRKMEKIELGKKQAVVEGVLWGGQQHLPRKQGEESLRRESCVPASSGPKTLECERVSRVLKNAIHCFFDSSHGTLSSRNRCFAIATGAVITEKPETRPETCCLSWRNMIELCFSTGSACVAMQPVSFLAVPLHLLQVLWSFLQHESAAVYITLPCIGPHYPGHSLDFPIHLTQPLWLVVDLHQGFVRDGTLKQ